MIHMKTQSEKLISELINITRQNLNFAELLKQKSDYELKWRENPETWNVLECLEHLNLYGDFYIPEIENAINNSITSSKLDFESGFLGNYFAMSMLPKEKLNKIKTFKSKNPLNSNLDRGTISRFVDQQLQFIALLERSRKVDLNKVKIKISISKWIQIKLGDAFRFVINHNIRHIWQIEGILAKNK